VIIYIGRQSIFKPILLLNWEKSGLKPHIPTLSRIATSVITNVNIIDYSTYYLNKHNVIVFILLFAHLGYWDVSEVLEVRPNLFSPWLVCYICSIDFRCLSTHTYNLEKKPSENVEQNNVECLHVIANKWFNDQNTHTKMKTEIKRISRTGVCGSFEAIPFNISSIIL